MKQLRPGKAPPAPRFGCHAELTHLERITHYRPLACVLSHAAHVRLLERLRQTQKAIGKQTSAETALRVLSCLGAVWAAGYRGTIGPGWYMAAWARWMTAEKCSEGTWWNAIAILEAARFIDRGTAARAAFTPINGRSFVRRDGDEVTRVSALTFSRDANELFAPLLNTGTGSKENRTQAVINPRLGDEGTRDSSVLDRLVQAPRVQEERPSGRLSTRPAPAAPPPTLEHRPRAGPEGPGTALGERSLPRSTPPPRVVTGRPRPEEPRTLARGVRALAYDLETELHRRGDPDTPDHVRRFLAEAGGELGPPPQDWTAWAWSWRELEPELRRRLLGEAIVRLRAGLRRRRLFDLAPDPTYRAAPSTGAALLAAATGARWEPGPRSRAPAELELPPPSPPAAAGPRIPDWLARQRPRNPGPTPEMIRAQHAIAEMAERILGRRKP